MIFFVYFLIVKYFHLHFIIFLGSYRPVQWVGTASGRSKPLKFIEKGNLEVILFNLQSKMRAHNKVSQ